MNLTMFMWKLERVNKENLRLVIWTAPGYAHQLCSALSGWVAKRKNASSVVVRSPRCLADLIMKMGAPPEYCALLQEYADLWRVGRRGVRVSREVHEKRAELTQRLMDGQVGSNK